jgi:hypothetical protein
MSVWICKICDQEFDPNSPEFTVIAELHRCRVVRGSDGQVHSLHMQWQRKPKFSPAMPVVINPAKPVESKDVELSY